MQNLPIARWNFRFSFFVLCVFMLSAGLTACGHKVKLMPTPVAYQNAQINPFSETPEQLRSTKLAVFYASNRPALHESQNKRYGNGVSNKLRLGIANMQIGDENLSWRQLQELSTSQSRAQEQEISISSVSELGHMQLHSRAENTIETAKEFAWQINQALQQKASKKVFIYLNGANSDFYRSVGLATQFAHFNGHQAVTVAFAWPSENSFFKYGQDVRNATATAPAFARFLAYMAEHTQAESFYILAYSAGAQVASQGLYHLRRMFPEDDTSTLKKRLRISHVYFAAPDEDTHTFVNRHLPTYLDMLGNVTVSLMYNDSVLWFARNFHGRSRLGRPEPGNENTSSEARAWLVQKIINGKLDILDMHYDAARVKYKLDFSLHGNWYKNTWVMSDILLQFYFGAKPAQRGLIMDNMRFDFPTWFFSDHYPGNVQEAVRLLVEQEKLPENILRH